MVKLNISRLIRQIEKGSLCKNNIFRIMEYKMKKILAICLATIMCLSMVGCAGTDKVKSAGKCTISVECSTIMDNLDKLDESVKDYVPEDGIILKKTEVEFAEGESVYDVLTRVLKENKILMEASFTGNSAYVEGIDNIYEFSCGELSGWQYSVNGVFPGKSCSDYLLGDGDAIEWRYTCDLGEDLK